MRLLFLEFDTLSPSPEVEPLLSSASAPASQITANQNSQSPNPLPLYLGGAIACGSVLFLGFMYYFIKMSCRRVGDQYMAEAAVREMTNRDAAARRRSGGGSTSLEMKTPPRVPVVIIEPDYSVEVAYPIETEPRSSLERSFRRFSAMPLFRAPTLTHSLSSELADVELAEISSTDSPPPEKSSNETLYSF